MDANWTDACFDGRVFSSWWDSIMPKRIDPTVRTGQAGLEHPSEVSVDSQWRGHPDITNPLGVDAVTIQAWTIKTLRDEVERKRMIPVRCMACGR